MLFKPTVELDQICDNHPQISSSISDLFVVRKMKRGKDVHKKEYPKEITPVYIRFPNYHQLTTMVTGDSKLLQACNVLHMVQQGNI